MQELYVITARAVSAIENNHFSPSDFGDFCDRPDDLGTLARTLQQMLEILNSQQGDLITAQQQLNLVKEHKEQLIQDIISKILETCFPENSAEIINLINAIFSTQNYINYFLLF